MASLKQIEIVFTNVMNLVHLINKTKTDDRTLDFLLNLSYNNSPEFFAHLVQRVGKAAMLCCCYVIQAADGGVKADQTA